LQGDLLALSEHHAIQKHIPTDIHQLMILWFFSLVSSVSSLHGHCPYTVQDLEL